MWEEKNNKRKERRNKKKEEKLGILVKPKKKTLVKVMVQEALLEDELEDVSDELPYAGYKLLRK